MNPQHRALLRQAEALQQQGSLHEAVAAYRHLLQQQPSLPDSWYNLGYLLKRLAQPEAALLAYEQALRYGVRGAEEVHLNRAVIYSDLLRRDELAQSELQAALKLAPEYLPALLNLGNLHEEQGQREAALACYERMLQSASGGATATELRAEALSRIAHLRPPSGADDALLAQLETVATQPQLPPETRANVLYALGRACDGLELSERAFLAFTQANASAALTGPAYEPAQAEAHTRALIEVFDRAVPEVSAGDSRQWEPLFICGMFRSGSTLLEQALGAHSLLQPGGELDFFPRLLHSTLAPFPAAVAGLDAHRWQAIAQDYRAHLQQLFPQSGPLRYISDKRPDNYALIGLLKQVFPGARFIHTVRDPRDVGLSIYMHHLDQRSLSYSTRVADIAHHYGQYQKLMAHWKTLYAHSILDFDYDQFVRDPRPALQRVLAFLGLDWEPSCLRFHEQRNTVKTASYWQVRRPLYASASGRWRRYASQLHELFDGFHHAGVTLPD